LDGRQKFALIVVRVMITTNFRRAGQLGVMLVWLLTPSGDVVCGGEFTAVRKKLVRPVAMKLVIDCTA
jgi:hypothetical protein